MKDEIKKNPHRVKYYLDETHRLKFKLEDCVNGITPLSERILYFEKANNLAQNVYTLEQRKDKRHSIKILRISNQAYPTDRIVNLLYHEGHYSYIKIFNIFCNTGATKSHYCHIKVCQKAVMPNNEKVGNLMMFRGEKKVNKVPIVLTGDFEAIN